MKTPLQELHQWVNSKLKLDGYEHQVILDKIESLIEKEKEVIERAYKQGVIDECGDIIDLRTITEAEEYYNRIFNTKEK